MHWIISMLRYIIEANYFETFADNEYENAKRLWIMSAYAHQNK